MGITDIGAFYLENSLVGGRLPPAYSRSQNTGTAASSVTPLSGGEPPQRPPASTFSALLEKVSGTDAVSGTDETKYGTGAARTPKVDKTDKLYEQCAELETFIIKILLSGMRKTAPKSELTKGGFAGEMYEDMLYDEYAKSFSRNAGFGLAELSYLELTGQRGAHLQQDRV